MARQARRSQRASRLRACGNAVPLPNLSGCLVVIVDTSTEPVTERAAAVWRVLEEVPDPEIPALSVVDLGIVRYVRWNADDTLHVGLTPTYTGCPATEVIRGSVRRALARAGYADAQVDTVLSPPLTSDW